MTNEHKERIVIDDTQLNHNSVVPITEMMRLFEICAFNHADNIGLDHKSMIEKSNSFWVVSKIKIQIKGEIHSGDRVTVKTWTHTPGLIRFIRDASIKVKNSLVMKATSEWCCLDVNTHKIVRAQDVHYPDIEMVENSSVNLEFSRLKPEISDKNYVYTKTIRATDLDLNMHTNNLKYNYITLDAFTIDELNSMDIKEYEIYFVNESHEGDKIDVYKQKSGKFYLIEGRVGEKTIFRTIIKFKKK